MDRVESTIDALGNPTSYEYDFASNLIKRTDARGLVTTYTPDELNRLQQIDNYDGQTLVSSVEYGYDAIGQRTFMIDDTGETNYARDVLGRWASVEYPSTDVISYEYDALGNMVRAHYPDDKTVNYSYNADHSLSAFSGWVTPPGHGGQYVYNNAGLLTKVTHPYVYLAWTDYEYDNADRLTAVTNQKAGPTTISSFDYTLDAVGNRTAVENNAGTYEYEYDPLYRLTQVTYPDTSTDAYTYDANGSRLTKDSTSYTYNAADQMLTDGGVSYGYDENGNQTSRDSDTFEYDHENRLIEAVIESVTSTSTYNGDGMRVSLEVDDGSPVTTDYLWDYNRSLPVVVDDGTLSYVYGAGITPMMSVDGSNNELFYMGDGLGSTTDIINSSQTVADTYTYDAFGAPTHATGSSTQLFGFTGQQTDEDSELQYLRARYYDPASGRFLSVDPIGAAEPYSYVGSNPTTFVDPSGLCRVEVRAHPVAWWARKPNFGGLGLNSAYHTYIYLFDPTNSSEYAFRGGSSGLGDPFGLLSDLSVVDGPYNSDFVDYDREGDDPSTTILDDGASCGGLKAKFKEGKQFLNSSDIPYKLVEGPNSNSVVHFLLSTAGLEPSLPKTGCSVSKQLWKKVFGGSKCDIWAPGWNDPIPFYLD